ncbi:hypothetical protein ABEB36_003239 [Hypothenemus hampei]|uniref:Apoptosis regulatory protein Siva n=1 Tax=Hypothenemus hampei TaxID=57062 RepID=A0ABD1F8H7_HYPHA
MSKRLCPFTDTDDQNVIQQPIKKQGISRSRGRSINSMASERTLQLLFAGALKQNVLLEEYELKCCYCDKFLCDQCLNCCSKCEQEYCKNCCFTLPDDTICYSCY